jgi:multisubunit Na+/H+ antiporter MnhE subunit
MNQYLALFIVLMTIASITVAAWFLGAIIGTVAIVVISASLVVFLLWFSALYLWELIKMVFKPRKKSPSNSVKN